MIDEEVAAVILAIAVVAGIFAASQVLFGERVVEPFSAIGLLGPDMKIGDYPRKVVVNETFRLHVYIENREGRLMYYVVYVKLGDNTTLVNETVPADAPIIARYETIVPHGSNVTIPVELSISSPVSNARLIFELWFINETTLEPQYRGRWLQLWLDVVQPKRS